MTVPPKEIIRDIAHFPSPDELAGVHLHLVGAGGMGMAPLALFLAECGARLTAEDDCWHASTRRWLEAAKIPLGISGVLPSPTRFLIRSSAVRNDHPSVAAACELGIPVLRRGEVLARVSQSRRLLAVAGTHGKTTTTAMLVHCLRQAGCSFSYILGGVFADPAIPPARREPGEWLIAEVDESDGTIDAFHPFGLILLATDWDHADRYESEEALRQTYLRLAQRTRAWVLHPVDEPLGEWENWPGGHPSCSLYSFGPEGDFNLLRCASHPSGLELTLAGQISQNRFEVAALGDFNARNATAALAAVHLCGVTPSPRMLAHFPGVARRQTCLFRSPRLIVYHDYGHHPAELRALLPALRKKGPGPLLVVFQPHRFSRTRRFREEFARELSVADELVLLPVYAASEEFDREGSTEAVADAMASLEGAPPWSVAVDPDKAWLHALQRKSESGYLTLAFIGAGDIDGIAEEFVAWLVSEDCPGKAWNRFFAELSFRLDPATILRHQEPLANKTTMRVGGSAEWYAEPAHLEDAILILQAASRHGCQVHVLGRGSNILVPSEGLQGLVLRLNGDQWSQFTRISSGRYWAGAGLRLKELCGLASRQGLVGLEFLEGIPGTVGGALRMNAGAMGGWIFDLVEEVHYLTMSGELKVSPIETLQVGYRHCRELESAIAVGAVLRVTSEGDPARIRATVEQFQAKRKETQPREPSAGCIFKNPPGIPAGRLIEELGLKGTTFGGAEVSRVHGNFIINRNQATCDDVLGLIRVIREKAMSERGISLEPEVILLGANWKDVL